MPEPLPLQARKLDPLRVILDESIKPLEFKLAASFVAEIYWRVEFGGEHDQSVQILS